MLKFKGAGLFRQRLVLSTISGKAIRIDGVRASSEEPGLREFEANFLKLLDKLTNGTKIEINETGTSLRFVPGLLVGGALGSFECGLEKSVGYYMEALLCLGPFCKSPVSINLVGITNDTNTLSVDTLRTVTLPFLRHFGIEEGLELKVKRRGAPPEGGGDVYFKCPIVKSLQTVRLLDQGLVRRIRGVAYSTKVPPQTNNRVVDAARSVFSGMIGDVFIYTDHVSGKDSGKSAGYGLSLIAETTTGFSYSADGIAVPSSLPEDVGADVAKRLCEEISMAGCVDTSHQFLAALYMALGPEDVSQARFGKLAPFSIRYLRLIKDFFGVQFKIQADAESGTVLMTCLGVGLQNLARKVA